MTRHQLSWRIDDRRPLHPSIVAVCAAYLGTDTRPDAPADIAAVASHVATELCGRSGDLTAIRDDVALLLAEDRDALAAFSDACAFGWLEHPPELAALKWVLSTCLEALDYRISWELTQTGN